MKETNPERQSKKTLDAWQISAQYWDKYRTLIAQMFAPLLIGDPGRAGWR